MPTGGYGYDRRILAGLTGLGWRVELRSLTGSFPVPSAADLRQAATVLRSIPDAGLTVVDGLAFGALPELAQTQRERLRLVALVHHPLAQEPGLAEDLAARLRQSETRALAQARLVVVTSDFTARLLGDYGVPLVRIRVVEPGTDPAPESQGAPDGPPRLLSVGALIPRKGHDLLLRGLADLRDLPWRLDCIGCTDRDPDWTRALLRLREALGLRERVSFSGRLTAAELDRRYAEAHLFVLATRFEGYGMVFAEALARGLPIVALRSGAVPGLVPPGAGLLVPPEDPAALARALRAVLEDRDLRRGLAAGSRAAGARLPTWPRAAGAFAAACAEVLHG